MNPLLSFFTASRRWLVLVLLAVGCQAPAPEQAARPTPPLAPVPLPMPAQLGYHRYIGTIGGRPVLAEMALRRDEPLYPGAPQPQTTTLDGTFYYRATGRGGTLGEAYQPRLGQWLETYYWTPGSHRQVTLLCAEQPFGPLLTGWYTPYGQQQRLPVRLRESYQGGVRYELLHEQTRIIPESGATTDSYGEDLVEQTYLHLLGPDTLRPALARLQCPPPAARRQARQARAVRLSAGDYSRGYLDVTFNEDGLLATERYQMQGSAGTRNYSHQQQQQLFDLRTGRALSLAGQLRPGGWRQLQRLLTRQALADTTGARRRAYWWRGGQLPLPTGGLALLPTGWVATYIEPDSELDRHGYSQTLSWAVVRPLLRPGSPLRRLVRMRGLP